MKNTGKSKRWLLFSLVVVLLTAAVVQITNRANANQTAELRVVQENNEFALSAGELGAFYRTPRRISDARVINLPESGGQIFLWNEDAGNGGRTPNATRRSSRPRADRRPNPPRRSARLRRKSRPYVRSRCIFWLARRQPSAV